MALTVQDVMTTNPTVLGLDVPLRDAARVMRDGEIGDVLVADGDRLCGIVTDRDIVVRGLAQGVGVGSLTLADVCTTGLATVAPTDAASAAADVMRANAVRRLPVVRDGQVVGIVSLGDLAIDRDPNSALAGISAAPTSP